MSAIDDRPVQGQMLAAVSSSAVQILADYTGRGPTKARTYMFDDLLVILLRDTLTKGERRLHETGEGGFVLDARRRFQTAMQADLTAMVEELTGRSVLGFMSANHLDPDLGSELFVLEPQRAPGTEADARG
jgi:uncharacterized protein YbcI